MSKIVLGFTQAVGELVEVAFEVYSVEHGIAEKKKRWNGAWEDQEISRNTMGETPDLPLSQRRQPYPMERAIC